VKRAIFISYRRDDSEGEAGRLYDDLVRTYGDSSVFMDVAGIDPGSDFRKAIDDNVATCGVFLAVIGPHWATIANEAGKRRLDDANDFVRLEVASALAKNIAVIPVLVHEARMPGPDQMPDAIKDLAYRNSVELTHARWNSDVQLLIKALQRYVTTNAATEADPVHATVSVQLPPPVPAEPAPSTSASKLPLVLGGAIVVLVALIAVLVYALTHRNEHRPPHPEPIAATNAAQADVSASQANVLTGNWRNTKNVTGQDALLGLKIDGSGPAYNVVPVAKCAQGECQWDLRTIMLSSGQASGQWKLANTQQEIKTGRTVTVTMRPDGQYLAVDVKNEYPNDSAEPEKDFHYRFAKQ
jgi:hypothetical protein